MPIDTLLIIHASREYHTFHRRPLIEALADALPERWAMLCVDRPLTLDAPARKSFRWCLDAWRERRPRQITPKLFLFRPVQLAHELIADRIFGLAQSNRLLLRRQLCRVIDELFSDVEQVISWISDPVQQWAWELLPDEKTVYECYDEYGINPDGSPRPRVQRKELRALARADVTFITAENMASHRRLLTKRIVYLPNGVPTTFITASSSHRSTIEHHLPPCIGYLGNLRQEVDIPLLEGLARENPQWEFVFIGPVQKAEFRRRLGRLSNVRFTGTQPHDSLPHVLQQVDVGLIPFQRNEFTRVLNPLKTYEYMAAGVPIVASNLPELRRFSHLIRFVENTPQAFAEAIRRVLAADRETLRQQLIETARQYTWENICRGVVVPELRQLATMSKPNPRSKAEVRGFDLPPD